jgi:multiple sugar transport system permease protein
VLLMYQQGFRWWNLGYSAAIAFVLFGVILLGSLLQSKLQKRGEAR